MVDRVAGTYVYERNGVAVELHEWFNVDGTCVHAEREQPGGVRMVVDARLREDGLVSEFALEWTHGAEGQIAERSVQYRVNGAELRTIIDGVSATRPVDPDAVLFPLLRVFQGPTIFAVAATGATGRTVIIPDLHAMADPERLLCPMVERRTAALLGTNQDGIGTYTYEGSVYDANARFLIDIRSRALVGYTFAQSAEATFHVRRIDDRTADSENVG